VRACVARLFVYMSWWSSGSSSLLDFWPGRFTRKPTSI